MPQRISSLRLTCGSRDSQVMLYDFWNTGSTLLAGTHPRYYFVPQWNLSQFDLFAGGEPPASVFANIGAISSTVKAATF